MTTRKVLFLASLTILLIAGYLLITGAPVLTAPVPGKPTLPMGTFITWAGIIALPLTIFWGTGRFREPARSIDKFMAVALKVLIGLAVLWAPICYLLAGNLSFSFTEKAGFQGGQTAMKTFWYFNYLLVVAPIMLLLLYGLLHLFHKKTVIKK